MTNTAKINRKSPYAEQVVNYVANNPGCTKADVARHVTYRRHFSRSYPIVNTAIRCGNLRAEYAHGRYALYVA